MDFHTRAVSGRPLPSPGTSGAALLAAGVFIAGCCALTLAGRGLPPLATAIVLAAAAMMAGALLAAMWLVAALEAASGRAWASGFRRLAPGERSPAAIVRRGLRYATVLWAANGAAFWVAALLGWAGA